MRHKQKTMHQQYVKTEKYCKQNLFMYTINYNK